MMWKAYLIANMKQYLKIKIFFFYLPYFHNGVYDPMRELRSRAHQHCCVLRDGSFHGLDRNKAKII